MQLDPLQNRLLNNLLQEGKGRGWLPNDRLMAGDIFLFSRLSVPQGGWHPALAQPCPRPAAGDFPRQEREGQLGAGGMLRTSRWGEAGAASRSRQVFKKGIAELKRNPLGFIGSFS